MRSKSENLKPCPFCASENVRLHVPYFTLYTVQCYHCNCTTALFQTVDEAIEAWNRRSNKEIMMKIDLTHVDYMKDQIETAVKMLDALKLKRVMASSELSLSDLSDIQSKLYAVLSLFQDDEPIGDTAN